MQVTLFIPILNERDGLEKIMPTIPREKFYQILIVDGGSSDGSVEWCEQNGYEVYIQKQKGLRAAYAEAWPLIRGDYVITFSPDGNCLAQDLEVLINKAAEGYDMVIASRYFGGAKSEDDTPITRFGNWFFSTIINLFHGGNYADAMTIYRIYRTKMFYELELGDEYGYLPEKWFFTKAGVEPLLSIRALKANLKVAEIPSDEPKRITGRSKLQVVRWGLTYLAQVIREKYVWIK